MQGNSLGFGDFLSVCGETPAPSIELDEELSTLIKHSKNLLNLSGAMPILKYYKFKWIEIPFINFKIRI